MHISFMRRCLELAERGRGKVSPNPLVGCVVVKDDNIIAEGWHEALGARHAERMALEAASAAAAGDTLYVNLEPCLRAGKQPPCTEIILKSGIRRVVFGAGDPSNSSAAMLRERGVEVIGGILEVECRRLNRGFLSLKEQGRPWVTLKKAMMRDGRVANPEGQPRLIITSEEQDEWSHTHLRATHDAILVGSGTIKTDNPHLNVRYVSDAVSKHIAPRRIILDPHNEIPATARVLTDADAARTLILREKLTIPELLRVLQEGGITSLLVEGGPGVWKAFELSGCVDEMVTLVES